MSAVEALGAHLTSMHGWPAWYVVHVYDRGEAALASAHADAHFGRLATPHGHTTADAFREMAAGEGTHEAGDAHLYGRCDCGAPS